MSRKRRGGTSKSVRDWAQSSWLKLNKEFPLPRNIRFNIRASTKTFGEFL